MLPKHSTQKTSDLSKKFSNLEETINLLKNRLDNLEANPAANVVVDPNQAIARISPRPLNEADTVESELFSLYDGLIPILVGGESRYAGFHAVFEADIVIPYSYQDLEKPGVQQIGSTIKDFEFKIGKIDICCDVVVVSSSFASHMLLSLKFLANLHITIFFGIDLVLIPDPTSSDNFGDILEILHPQPHNKYKALTWLQEVKDSAEVTDLIKATVALTKLITDVQNKMHNLATHVNSEKQRLAGGTERDEIIINDSIHADSAIPALVTKKRSFETASQNNASSTSVVSDLILQGESKTQL